MQQVCGLNYNGVEYFYQRDLTGNINSIIDKQGKVIVQYSYTAFGVPSKIIGALLTSEEESIANVLMEHNIYLYKGYCYDAETGLYYNVTRYYNPEWGRFLNADDVSYLDPETIGGLNLYAYCGNNPVMGYDPMGTFDWNRFWKNAVGVVTAVGLVELTVTAVVASGGTLLIPVLIGAGIGAGASLVGQGVGNLLSGKGFFEDISITSNVMGGLAGAAFATGVGGLWGAVGIGSVSSAGSSAFEQKSWANIGVNAVVGGIAAGLGYGAGKMMGRLAYKNSDLVFKDVFQLAILDTNKALAAAIAFRATYYTFLPSVTTGLVKGLTKYLGNKGLGF